MDYAHHGMKRICSARSEFSWYNVNGTNSYDWHEFRGSLSVSGPLGPDYWWDLIYQMNTQYDSSTATNVWNAFFHAGQHMYVVWMCCIGCIMSPTSRVLPVPRPVTPRARTCTYIARTDGQACPPSGT